MKPFTLVPKACSDRISLNRIVPHGLTGLTLSEIAELPIEVNGGRKTLNEYFEIIDGDRFRLVFAGDFAHCDHVGGEMHGGEIQVLGSAGDFVGSKLIAGKLKVEGNVGLFAASGMRGGLVEVNGNCGDYAAAAALNLCKGMSGGTLVVRGSCQRWLGSRMRRGTVIVHGQIDKGCASRMIAGTIVACSHVAQPFGADMKRGTLVLLAGDQIAVPAGFTAPERTELSFLSLLLQELLPHLPQPGSLTLPSVVRRSLGDRVQNGLGEIIWATTHNPLDESRVAHA